MQMMSFNVDEFSENDIWFGMTHGRECSDGALRDQAVANGFSRLFTVRQVHGSDIVDVSSSSLDAEADAIVCYERGVLLCVRVADCCGIVVYHPGESIVACIHSGWRGTRHGIAQRTVNRLVHDTGIAADEFMIWLSACASGEAYEVRSDVQQHFPDHCRSLDEERFLFDNRSALRQQLIDVGVSEENIRTSESCTIKDTRYHSYRRDGAASGRNIVFIGHLR